MISRILPALRSVPMARCLSRAGSRVIVYKLTPFKEAVAFARNLGVATGIAFDCQGLMHVGDRSGTIFKVNGIGEERAWTEIEPSVSAFHLAFGPDDSLTSLGQRLRVSIRSGVSTLKVTSMCFSKDWDVHRDSRLIATGTCMLPQRCVAGAGSFASLRMARGEMVVAGVNLVGLAFSARERWQSFRSIQSTVCPLRSRERCFR